MKHVLDTIMGAVIIYAFSLATAYCACRAFGHPFTVWMALFVFFGVTLLKLMFPGWDHTE